MVLRLFAVLWAALFASCTALAQLGSVGAAPVNLQEGSLAAVGTNIVLIGGRQAAAPFLLNTVSGQWRSGAPMPRELHHFQAVVWRQQILVIGAFTGSFPDERPVEEVWAYSPGLDSWQVLGLVPEDRRRGAASAVVIGDVLYLVGGIVNGHRSGHVPWLDRFDLKKKKWNRLVDAPRARDHAAVITVRGKLYFLGGRQSKAPDATFRHTVSEIDVYDITKKKWSTLSQNLPTPRAGLAAIAIGKLIITLGGESERTNQIVYHNDVEVFDLTKKNWRSVSALNCKRHGFGAVASNNRVWVGSGLADSRKECDHVAVEAINFVQFE